MKSTEILRQDMTVIISKPIRDAQGINPGDIIEIDVQKIPTHEPGQVEDPDNPPYPITGRARAGA